MRDPSRINSPTNSVSRLPFGPVLRSRVEKGEDAALLLSLIAIASFWLEASGTSIRVWRSIGSTACVVQADPCKGALMAAALDLLNTIELSPQGRKAIADFCRQPLPQQTEGE